MSRPTICLTISDVLTVSVAEVKNRSAIAQYRQALRYLFHLFKKMRNVNHRMAAAAQARDQFKELLRIGKRQATGRFIENEKLASNRQRPGDFHQLLRSN
jgi:hypothetical protein